MKLIRNFPSCKQPGDNECGPVIMSAVLAYYGIDIRVNDLSDMMKTTLRTGTPIGGFKRAAKRFGLEILHDGEMDLEGIIGWIDDKKPVIMAIQAWPSCETGKKDLNHYWHAGHYVAAIGYGKDRIIFEDPVCAVRTYLSFEQVNKRWHDIDYPTNGHTKKLDHYGLVLGHWHGPVYKPNIIVPMDWNSYEKDGNTLKIG